MRISDWSSDVCSSDLYGHGEKTWTDYCTEWAAVNFGTGQERREAAQESASVSATFHVLRNSKTAALTVQDRISFDGAVRSEEHTSELQSLMRISYAVFCLKKNKHIKRQAINNTEHNKKTK